MRGAVLCEMVREGGLSRDVERVQILQRSGETACQGEGAYSCKWTWCV